MQTEEAVQGRSKNRQKEKLRRICSLTETAEKDRQNKLTGSR